jgi:hypothetical protein
VEAGLPGFRNRLAVILLAGPGLMMQNVWRLLQGNPG